MVEDSVRDTFDEIMNQKQKEGMSITEAESSAYDALLEHEVDVILTAHPTKVNQIPSVGEYTRFPFNYQQL